MTERDTVRVTLDAVQLAWLDGLAELHEASRAAVMREALSYFVAREYVRLERMVRVEEFRAMQQRTTYPPPYSFGFLGRHRP